MYTVWPAYEINPDDAATKTLVPAVKMALRKRDHHVREAHDALQRSIAWIRVKNGNEFAKIFKYLLENQYLYNALTTSHNNGHHVYNYDTILSLQGILIETALFTQPGLMELAPALPDAFTRGRLSGIRGRNQTEVNELQWDVNKGTFSGTITSQIDQTLTLIHRAGIKSVETDVDVTPSPLGNFARELNLKAGERTPFLITF